MYEYMVEAFGPRAPLALMMEYATGVREEDAYQKVLKVSRAEFLSRFKVWAKGQVIAWGLLPKPGQPTMAELLKSLAPEPAPEPAADAEGAGAVLEALAAKDAKAPDAEVSAAKLDEWLATYPDHADVLELALDRALAANNAEPTPAMVPLIERYAAARPVDPKPHRLIARLALAENASEDLAVRAVGALEYLDVREEKLAAYAAQLAELYAMGGDMRAALAKADRATRISPYDARLRELAARVALVAQAPAAAREHIRMLVALEPGQAVHRRRLEAVNKMIP